MSKNDDEKFFRLIKAYRQSTRNLLDYAKEGDFDNCNLESKNRERITKIIEGEYWKIKKKSIGENNADQKLGRDWEKEFRSFVVDSASEDVEILDVLTKGKSGLQKAIASIYKIRKKIQSYNSNSGAK